MKQQTCEKCERPGDLVCQTVQPGIRNGNELLEPWVFRYYLCRWHRAGCQRKRVVLDYIDDATLLSEYNKRKGAK